jgi:hypothetical protein
MNVRLAIELLALAFVVIVTAIALWRSWAHDDDHAPPADPRDTDRKTLSIDLRDREP